MIILNIKEIIMNDILLNCLIQDGRGYEKLSKMKKIEFQMFVLFMALTNTQFKWEGLPKEIKPYNLEKILNLYGQGVFFKYGEDYLVCSCANTSLLNIYGEPVEVLPIALNGISFDRVNVSSSIDANKKVVVKNAVRIRNNLTSTPTYFMLKPFIDKLCFIWESMGINAGLSRVKYLLHSNKQLASAMKTELKKLVGGSECIPVVNEKVNVMKEIEKLDFNIPYEPDKYWEDFDKTFHFMCEMCGITTNISNGKKERLIVSEVESNDELTTLLEDTRLEFRQQACEEINELFKLNVSVKNKVEEVKPTSPTETNPNKDNSSKPQDK